MTNTAPIIDKIKKLLALASNNSSEAESARAMEMASNLMAKHGIEQDQLKEKSIIVDGDHSPLDVEYYRYTGQAAQYLSGAEFFLYLGSAPTFNFVGRSANVEFAQLLMAHINLQIEALYKQALPKGLTQRERAKFRKDFKIVAARRVNQRAREILETQVAASSSTALVLHKDALKNEVHEYLAQKGVQVRSVKAKARSFDSRAHSAGILAGNQVELNSKVSK